MFYPATAAIRIIRRSTFQLNIQLIGANNEPFDITSKTMLAQLWNRARTEKYLDFDVNVISAQIGLLQLNLEPDQSIDLPNVCVFDLKGIETDSREYYYLTGNATVVQGYTDD